MSFKLLKEEVIDLGLCQGCALCAGTCKHIEIKDLKPQLKDFCILEKTGQKCGRCYENCPQVIQKKLEKKSPLEVISVQTNDPQIKAKATSGGFVTTLNKYLLENQKVSHLVEVKNNDSKPEAVITTKPEEVFQYAGVTYGRAGVLKKIVEVMGKEHQMVGVVGVPCEIRGAENIEKQMKKDILRVGLFCNSNIRSPDTDQGLIYSPCQRNCPAGVDASGYVNKIRNGKFQEAVNLIREKNPLPSVCGRVCTHECEYNCTLIGTNHPIAIRELKKFVTEWEMDYRASEPASELNKEGKKVAIIGSGPAGLTAAYYLALKGYRPSIFEKSDKVGGMLRHGVPAFRLPDKVLDYDIEMVKRAGVEIKTNTPLGPNLTFDDLKTQGYEAIFIATGQYMPRTLKLPGEDLPNVHVAINFLLQRKYRYWENQAEFKDKTMIVLGGGPVAVDVAQTALRLGAKKVYLVEIRSKAELKVVVDEIPKNEFKLMEYLYDTSTNSITKAADGQLQINCHKVKQRVEQGKINFDKIEGSEFSVPTDSLVIAIGQAVDYAEMDAAGGNKLERKQGKIIIDEMTMATNLPGVFAGGDIVFRSKMVAVAAIAQGREAAESIDRYLRGEDLKANRFSHWNAWFNGPLNAPKDVSQKPPTLEAATEELWKNFSEVEGKFTQEMAVQEAKRCLSCNNFCAHCQDFAAIHADIAAGEVGSEKGFTTVVIWSDRGKKIVEEMFGKGLLTKGKINLEAVDKAINKKMLRQLVAFTPSPRERILQAIKNNGPSTISALTNSLKIPAKDVRFNALRLVQEHKLEMKLEENADEPQFSLYVDVPSE